MENYEYENQPVEQPEHKSKLLHYFAAFLAGMLLLCIGFYLGTQYKSDSNTRNASTIESTTIDDKVNEQGSTVEVEKVEYEEDINPVVQKKPYEIWLITTSFDTVFLSNASNYREPTNPELVTDREYFTAETFVENNSYKDLEVLYIEMDKEYEIRDTRNISGSDIMYTTASYDGTDYALEIDLKSKEATVLFSGSEYPDFVNTSISSASTNNQALLFMMSSCTGCAPSLAGQAVYNLNTGNYIQLGKTSAFEWLDNTSFRYKPIPQGCDDYFTNPFAKEVPDPICEQKLIDTEWIANSV